MPMATTTWTWPISPNSRRRSRIAARRGGSGRRLAGRRWVPCRHVFGSACRTRERTKPMPTQGRRHGTRQPTEPERQRGALKCANPDNSPQRHREHGEEDKTRVIRSISGSPGQFTTEAPRHEGAVAAGGSPADGGCHADTSSGRHAGRANVRTPCRRKAVSMAPGHIVCDRRRDRKTHASPLLTILCVSVPLW